MAGFGKSSHGVSSFSVRELLDLKDNSEESIEAFSETERSVYGEDEEKLETRKLDPEMRGKNEDETDSSRFI
jgi:hypothetical protein